MGSSSSTIRPAPSMEQMHRSPSLALIVHPEYHHTLPMEPVKFSFWDACDDAVLREIASYLGDAQSLLSLQLVNRRCRRVADDDGLWRELCVAKFNCHPDVCTGAATWRELYKFNAEAFKYILAQTAAEALMKLGIRATAQNFVLNVQGISAA
uniref:F-box domain-containing protein n=1 Tax=Tetradesmus obliquus TaxID=3088 RepID=A0A383W9V4_TETOB|eukprot:jgi/Sobl393_1/2846/SZX73980.1